MKSIKSEEVFYGDVCVDLKKEICKKIAVIFETLYMFVVHGIC